MKTHISSLIAVAMLALPLAGRADDWDGALRGGLLGAAIGAIVGHNSDDISSSVAVPAFAAAGALLGYVWDQNDWGGGYDNDGYHHNDYPYRYSPYGYGYGNAYGRYGYGSGYGYNRYDDYRRPVYRRPDSRDESRSRKRGPSVTGLGNHNLQPGVELVSVPMPLPGGHMVDIKLIRLAQGYVGPQGEHYDELPDGNTLASRYYPAPTP